MTEKEFFIIIRQDSPGPPTKMHDTLALAEQEAERLARKHPMHRFYVFKSLGYVVTNDITWVKSKEVS
jgi:hypothetical protein